MCCWRTGAISCPRRWASRFIPPPDRRSIGWDLQSPLFANLFEQSQEPFRERGGDGAAGASPAAFWRVAEQLGKLADGNIIMRGTFQGRAAMGRFTPCAADLPLRGVVKPRTATVLDGADGLAGWPWSDSGKFTLRRRATIPGRICSIPVAGPDHGMEGVTLDVTTPTKAVINARAVMSGDVPRLVF